MTKLFVTMTDTFMSGWGVAEGKTNKLVVECDTAEQAHEIEAAAKERGEMKYVKVCGKLPYYAPKRFVTSHKHYDQMTGWHRQTEGGAE